MCTKTLTTRVLLSALVCSWIATATADQTRRPKNDPFDDMPGVFSIGPMVDALGKAAEGFAAAKAAYAELDREIQAARKDYWAKYPDRPGFAQAEATFAKKLYEKDLNYLLLARVDGRCQGGDLSRYKNAMGTAMNMAGAEVDGGLAGGAGSAFCTWVNAARGRIDLVGATKLPEYATYRRARDWGELVRAGRVTFASPYDLLASKDPRWYALGLIWGHNEYGIKRDALVEGIVPDILQRAKATFDTLAKTHGREKVLGIARKVMEAPKRRPDPKIVNDGLMDTGFMHLADPKAIGCVSLYADVEECFFQLLLPRTEPIVAAPAPVKHSGRGAARGAAPPVTPPATTAPVSTTPPVPTTSPVPTAPEAPPPTDSVPRPAAQPTTTTPPVTKPLPEQTETLAERQAKTNQDVTTKTHSILADLKKKAEAQQAQAAAASQTASQGAAQPPAGVHAQATWAPAGPAWQLCGGDLKSGASQTAVPVEFVNTSTQPRKLLWLDFAGAKIVAGILQPGQRAPMQTYTTHAWMIADGSDQCMGTLVISKPGSIEIR